MRSALESSLRRLLKDFGYTITLLGENKVVLIEDAIRGFTSSRVVGTFRSAVSAAEHMCPIVRDDSYTSRLSKLTSGV